MKRFCVSLAYGLGLFGLYHRLRNRKALTVISLHRVLAESDPRWQTCDPLYTLSDRVFDQCLTFLSRHYAIVSLDDVEKAVSKGQPLPPCPLLITFDDGWADNHEYALPALQRRGFPAVLFVASDVLDRREAFFQERLIGAWRSGRLGESVLRDLWSKLPGNLAAPADLCMENQVRSLIVHLQKLPVQRREQLLAGIESFLADDTRQMLTVEELREIRDSGVAVGTHGKAHEALTTVPDADAELRASKKMVAAALAVAGSDVTSVSFPFSKHNSRIIEQARAAGYRLLFGGGLSLNPLSGTLPDLIARVGISAGEVVDRNGDLRAAALAAYLFRRPRRALVAG